MYQLFHEFWASKLLSPGSWRNFKRLVYDFKQKGERILKYSSYPLCDLTLKWSNFFPIDRISKLEKYVMFQHQVCLFSRKFFDFVSFSRF